MTADSIFHREDYKIMATKRIDLVKTVRLFGRDNIEDIITILETRDNIPMSLLRYRAETYCKTHGLKIITRNMDKQNERDYNTWKVR